jgi:hypothetical protein
VIATNSQNESVRYTILDGKITLPFSFLTDGELEIKARRRDATTCGSLLLFIQSTSESTKSATANIYAMAEYIGSLLKSRDALIADIAALNTRLTKAEKDIADFNGQELF